jgi:hypothetical protein
LIEFPPSPSDNKWQAWAQRLLIYLVRARSILKHKKEEESASEDGVLLWDRENDYPTVSRNGVYTQVVLQGGHAYLTRITNVTAAASDTAYSIVWDTPTISDGVTLGTPASRVVFAESGEYLASFSAQPESTSASDISFWFWFTKNGGNAEGRAIKTVLHNNNGTSVVSRTSIFQITAGDYLEVNWATSNSTNGRLSAHTATAFAPVTPSVTMSITRVHG